MEFRNVIPNSLDASLSINTFDFNSMMAYYSTHSTTEDEVYYYHGDHLGGANWITDAMGRPVQHLQYLPFGENYINQRATGSTYQERYTFTGKERDEETGYGYFGARYMDYELMTGWLSVDPMSDKYPSISPYNYCMWNPVKLVDPDGKEVDDDWYMTKSGEVKWDKNVKGPDDVPEGCIYLGKNPMMVTSQDDKVRILNPDGTSGEVPIHGKTHISTTTGNDAVAVPVSVSFGTFLWDNISAAAGAIFESAVSIAWILPACLLVSSDSSPTQDIRGGHDNNVRKSTKGKHEGGDKRRLQDQHGSRGEKIMKGKRPQGYKGPWPPQKKK